MGRPFPTARGGRRAGALRAGRLRAGGLLAGGLLAGTTADALLADPRRWHPVAGFGRYAAAVERRGYAPTRAAGVRHVLVCAGVPALLAARLRPRRPATALVLTGLVTWTVLGATSLRRTATAVGASVRRDDLAGARAGLPALCGRDPAALDAAGLRRAVVESLAENTSDAAVAPLLWGAVAGVPGLVGYRAVNTLDAMVGHRDARYRDFGWAAARLDDLANLAPARLTGLLAVGLAPLVGGAPAAAWQAWRRDAADHPSPNAGVCEAAFAGALGVRLGGPTVYAAGPSARPWLGDGRAPTDDDVVRAARLSGLVVAAAAVVSAALALVIRR